MIIGTDESGKIWLTTNGNDASKMPTEFNGAAITAHVLTPPQEVAFLALDPLRGGTMFDGVTFAAIPAASVAPNNGAALVQSRRDEARRQIEIKIGSLSEDQQAVLRPMLQLIDKEI